MQGRKPKPSKLKVIGGNAGHRSTNNSEPTPRRAIPRCPTHLGKDARAEWKRLTKELDAVGLLTDLDRGALAAYCSAWGRWIEAEAHVADLGAVIQSDEGGYYQNPHLAVSNKAIDQMAKFGPLLGLDPSSRSRLHAVPQAQSVDPMAQLLDEDAG